ncbi:PQQ-like beta-propeller repeat protein [Acanthopleuribacter pedis]|uniref:PQQ-like beta-propeller repeat protein n=1 Tax=Acanthopleuribacter pedis TaxID=442870 RepID=A0A8J7U419_9BACT|nr:PQQ-like beta-propeller repeat protein [Acanthopleuribacter pedis]MBO1318913.1 PQQ-like beta-propeller repeat protein [Acanthopleuribacter pedis]
MTPISLLLLAFLFRPAEKSAPLTVPEPVSTWELAFQSNRSLLRENGESLVFRGAGVFIFDAKGNPLVNYTLAFEPVWAFLGPEQKLWVHDGKQRLGRVDDRGDFTWQQEVPPPTLAPVVFGDSMVYVRDALLELRDAQAGVAEYSSSRPSTIAHTEPWGDRILIAQENGEIMLWNPAKENKRIFLEPKQRILQAVSLGPGGEWALAYRGGNLTILSNARTQQWSREFYIDINTKPLWLTQNFAKRTRDLLVVATQGRRLYAYGPRGRQLKALRLKGRPMALVRWSDHACLLVPSLTEDIIYFDSNRNQVARQNLGEAQSQVIEAGDWLLLVSSNGIMRLYNRGMDQTRASEE